MPTLRSPVSGSRVTTHGKVMNRPPSNGQHCWIGRFNNVGGDEELGAGSWELGFPPTAICELPSAASKRCTTSLHGPSFTIFGLAWRRSKAWPSSLMASRKLVGGLAFISEPSSAATSSTEFAPMLSAMRLCEPIVLMASGNGDTTPLTVGFSNNKALPPPGDFISRSAISVISSSVATGWEMRFSSPAASSAWRKSRKELNAMAGG